MEYDKELYSGFVVLLYHKYNKQWYVDKMKCTNKQFAQIEEDLSNIDDI